MAEDGEAMAHNFIKVMMAVKLQTRHVDLSMATTKVDMGTDPMAVAALGEVLGGAKVACWFLKLDGNALGDAGVTALAEGLKTNKTVELLHLNNCGIGAEGATALAEALKVNQKLRKLYLIENKVGDVGAAALAEALKVNRTLQSLNLMTNGIDSPDVVKALQSAGAATADRKKAVSMDLFGNPGSPGCCVLQ